MSLTGEESSALISDGASQNVVTTATVSPCAVPSPSAECEAENAKRGLGIKAKGQATWYGGRFHGRRTANGDRFDKEEMTAAHPTLPFGTCVMVNNLSNSRKVAVRITDRCSPKRLIDVSEAAAELLGFKHAGVAPVELEVVELPENVPAVDSRMLVAQADAQVSGAEMASVESGDDAADASIEVKAATPNLKVRLNSASSKPSIHAKVRRRARR